MEFKPTGEFYNADWDNLLYETLGDDYLIKDKINIVTVTSDDFKSFCDADSEEEAEDLMYDFEYEEVGSIDYGDWEGLESLVGSKEAKNLRDDYFENEDYKEVISAVLLYWENKFITLVTAED